LDETLSVRAAATASLHSGGGGGKRLQKGIKHREHKERVST
jgi:hypothetical protein